MKAKRTAGAVALPAAVVVAGHYGRDLRRARARLARLERRTTGRPAGARRAAVRWLRRPLHDPLPPAGA
jgi:hypothetical protein